MKKITLLLFMLLGVMAFSQSNVTSILNEQCAFSGGCDVFSLGCCLEDDLNHLETNPNLCNYEVYYVTEDVFFDREHFILRNARLEFLNGASLFMNGASIEYTCNAEIVFIGGGQFVDLGGDTLGVESLEYANNYLDNTPYIVYNNIGQVVQKGVIRRNVALKFDLPKGIYYIRPKNYEATKFIISD